ncbi:response regulator transcription factor [Listeria kieliensis]|uniref:PhoP family transcriptional regulator n=1 Tax=Listeria kieliensis TaxID=1621700 RepID=A0A3D8TQK1_9LIST|nr:response regulator transcription factor [Listeria kieliensis]RDX00967.1 PhoP family transcriptional regulator [Listeria kieliensis]
MTQKIMVVEDEEDIAELIAETLTEQGYEVVIAKDGAKALQLFSTLETVDLVLLDLMLPKINGMDLLQRIRKEHRMPVLIISAKDGEYEKILGLEFGADDYLVKPFSILELQARVKALLRRNNDYQNEKVAKALKPIKIGELTIDQENLAVMKEGESLNLTAKEFQILNLFASNPKKVYTKVQLYKEIWDDEFIHDENVLNVHIRRLRKKIEVDPSNPEYIQTVWGIGYKLGVAEI